MVRWLHNRDRLIIHYKVKGENTIDPYESYTTMACLKS